MSSPIAIPVTSNSRAVAARSVPTDFGRAYVPVHRRGASASSLPDHSQLRAARLSAPTTGARSPSPAKTTFNRYDPLALADIPHESTIPQARIYSLATLLSLSSSPSVGLSSSQHAQVASHIPLMLRRSPSPSSPSSSPSKKTPSTTPAESPKKPEAAPRRRRTGRKPSAAKARVPPALGADVGDRRRRNAYGAGWGWSAAERVVGQRVDFGRVPQRDESWRAAVQAVPVAATA
ncbi:hypothetical protein C8Q77DRAFT_1162004 [Trametes polyzona]|nr:hypothetical protein C8Q77DRAFT_1162004 [Trametes polyzona]